MIALGILEPQRSGPWRRRLESQGPAVAKRDMNSIILHYEAMMVAQQANVLKVVTQVRN